MNIKIITILLAITVVASNLTVSYAQSHEKITIKWSQAEGISYNDTTLSEALMFDGNIYNGKYGSLPLFYGIYPLEESYENAEISISNTIFEQIDKEKIPEASLKHIEDEIIYHSQLSTGRKEKFATLELLPLRYNPFPGVYERLLSFEVHISPSRQLSLTGKDNKRTYATNSVLSQGQWYKFSISEDGIYKITYEQLADIGINASSLDPRRIKIYNNGGGMLPEKTDGFVYDDLQEISIYVSGEDDGSFDANDYILFYGQGPHQWEYNEFTLRFSHEKHLYSDKAYYFITTSSSDSKRIQEAELSTNTADQTITSFNDFAWHENDDVNLIKSGRNWLGEIHDIITEYEFDFSFPNIDINAEAYIEAGFAARSEVSTSYTLEADGNSTTRSITPISTNYNSRYANEIEVTDSFLPSSSTIKVFSRYNKQNSASAKGWLDYICLNVRRGLVFTGGQMDFRDNSSIGGGKTSKFVLKDAGSKVSIWEITDPLNIKSIPATLASGQLEFKLSTDSLRTFIAYDGSSFLSVSAEGAVANQDIHGEDIPELLIISHPLFRDQAERLARHHNEMDNMKTLIVEPWQVYNEFSSGCPDISAIRNMAKMFYDRDERADTFRYLLLFGDGSYDNKNRIDDNTNFILTYQSEDSYHPVISYVTDDYYGFLDPGEGSSENDMLDIGIGRLPVSTVAEAEAIVDKIIHYSTPSEEVMADWRNSICFVADDEDSNLHFNQAEKLANYVDTTYQSLNINKIYLDAYPEASTSGGERYPDVNEAINQQLEKGALILNYTGHGGEEGWAHERVLEIADINSWHNTNKLPVFVTATCEFSRFDDPERTSAGELVILNANGGSIALLTTSRATFGSPNFNLNRSIYEYAFEKINGKAPRLGDIFMLSKRQSGSDDNGRKFVLLGDPAQKLAYPEYKVITSNIVNKSNENEADTLQALSEILLEGFVADQNSNVMDGFNGTIQISIFDKAISINTLGNDGSSPKSFKLQKNIIYKGKAEVKNGLFSAGFLVPKDIAYNYGNGKISYYAQNTILDAKGFDDTIIIGGYNANATADAQGPEVSLYINDTQFTNGGITNENPILIAFVNDESGINTIGNGIGHDITAVLDDDTENIKVLNDYYESDLSTYKSGVVTYPYLGLSDGYHHIDFKIWDAYNNSSQASISFVVASSEDVILDRIFNYPNPFDYQTTFALEHNQAGDQIDIELFIYSLQGKLVRTIRETITASGYNTNITTWDGRGYGNQLLEPGMYIYKAIISKDDGSSSEKNGRLLFIRQ